jgi:LuxR family maltose regulon positive regulatory protein
MRTRLGDFRLTIPPLPPRHVPRPRLVAALDQAVEVPLTLVSAGAGAGKTVLLTEWARQRPDRVVWLTLSPVDAKPTRFWRLLAAALRQAGAPSPVGAGTLAVLATDAIPFGADPHSDGPIRRGGPGSLAAPGAPRAPEQLPAGVTVVIDGAQLITDPGILAALDRLIRGWGEGRRLVLLARSDPLLPLHRYRLAGLMRELRGGDLAMTRDEAEAVLAAHGVTLLPHEFDRLVTSTEGWVAGIRLSAMRMEGKAKPGEFVAELAVDQGSIGEYLLEEVLADQPESVRRMLVQTSFLDEVTGPLASAITGIDRCGEMLDELARTNSFVVRLDAVHARFRYHQLFRDVLRYLLQREALPDLPALCRRASAWFESNGDLSSAAYWALRESNRRHVVRLLTHGALLHAFVHRCDLTGWDVPELTAVIQRHTRAAPDATEHAVLERTVWALVASGEQAARVLSVAASIDESSADPVVLATWDLAELILGQKAGLPERVRTAARRLLGRDLGTARQISAGFRPAVMLSAAMAHFWEGGHHECAHLLVQCLKEVERSRAVALHAEVLGALSLVESYWTRSNRAEEVASRTTDLLNTEGLEAPESLQLATAWRCLIRADLAGLDCALKEALFRDVLGSEPSFEVMLRVVHASLLIASNEPVGAHAVLQRPSRYLPPPFLQTILDMQTAMIEQMLGRPRAALQILERYPAGYELAIGASDAGMAYLVTTTRAHAQLALGETRDAANGIRALLSSTSPQVGRYQIVDGLLCAALIAYTEDDQGQAVEMLMRALQVADDDIRLPLVRMTEAFTEMLTRHPSVAAQWPVPLQTAAPLIDRSTPQTGSRFPAVLLTDRERAVLRFLATGMSTGEIAGELCVSVNTVKTHLAAIYRKLPARKRREAVNRARELELL